MKQEQWVDIMVGSICDQTERARKTARRMATFFERKGDTDKANRLKKMSSDLERTQTESIDLYKEVEWQGNKE